MRGWRVAHPGGFWPVRGGQCVGPARSTFEGHEGTKAGDNSRHSRSDLGVDDGVDGFVSTRRFLDTAFFPQGMALYATEAEFGGGEVCHVHAAAGPTGAMRGGVAPTRVSVANQQKRTAAHRSGDEDRLLRVGWGSPFSGDGQSPFLQGEVVRHVGDKGGVHLAIHGRQPVTIEFGKEGSIEKGVMGGGSLCGKVGIDEVGSFAATQGKNPCFWVPMAGWPGLPGTFCPMCTDGATHLAGARMDEQGDLPGFDSPGPSAGAVDHLFDHLHLDKVVSSPDSAETVLANGRVWGAHRFRKDRFVPRPELALVKHPVQLCANTGVVDPGKPSQWALGAGFHVPGEALAQGCSEGLAPQHKVAGPQEVVAPEGGNQLGFAEEKTVEAEIGDMQAHAAVDVAAHEAGHDQRAARSDGADGHAAIPRMKIRGCADMFQAPTTGMRDGGHLCELVEGFGFEGEVVREEDLERRRVRGRRLPHGVDAVGTVDMQPIARKGAHEPLQIGRHDRTRPPNGAAVEGEGMNRVQQPRRSLTFAREVYPEAPGGRQGTSASFGG
jgi:hypothetical protein